MSLILRLPPLPSPAPSSNERQLSSEGGVGYAKTFGQSLGWTHDLVGIFGFRADRGLPGRQHAWFSGPTLAAASGGGTGGTGGAGQVDTACVTQILTGTKGLCTACHGDASNTGVPHYVGLDLESPNLKSRLLGKAPGTTELALCGATTTPLLVLNSSPATGLFLDKLSGLDPGCGMPMPPGASLSPAEFACIQTWANAVTMNAVIGP